MKRLVAAVLILGLAIIGLRATEVGRLLLSGRWSYVDRVIVDRGTFFRLKVKLTYKGEPQDFDLVVGCNVKITRYKGGGGSTYEASLTPVLFGRAMPDGKAVVIRPPGACGRQTTANGLVPADLIPLIVVYDDARLLTFGRLYLSEDAYNRPESELKFGGSVIESATSAEFMAFRESGTPNIVTREAYWSNEQDFLLAQKGLTRRPPMGIDCQAFTRLRVPEASRAVLRQHWPADRPRYWMPARSSPQASYGAGTGDIMREVERVGGNLFQHDDGGPWVNQHSFSMDGWGNALRRAGGSYIGPPFRKDMPPHKWSDVREKAPPFYPFTSGIDQYSWAKLSEPELEARLRETDPLPVRRIEIRDGATRGLAYCYNNTFGIHSERVNQHLKDRPGYSTVDGIVIENSQWRSSAVGPSRFFERDEYVYRIIILGIAGGDL